MADDLSKLNFSQDLEEVLHLPEAEKWKIKHVGDLEIYATLAPAKEPDESFQVRLKWDSYPGELPASLKFRDPGSGRLDMPAAWPVVRGFRPQSLDACVNYCAEGFGLHPEWAKDPNMKWQTNGNLILKLLRTLQNEMDEHFTGRFKQ